ncbi:MAG: efflux RND transporter periplasmic adaptor subunit [Firmicutes bacterium]|nr:efflux RND transporter periplasmic adaptor subunit [Bacillota bacterium]
MKRKKRFFDKEKLKNVFKPTKKKAALTLIVAVVVVAAVVTLGKGKKNIPTTTSNDTDEITRGDVEVTITGNASIEPYERYEIIPMVSGDIISSPYDVGDTVQKGDVLYKFDSSNTDLNLEKQRISLEQSRNNYNEAVKDADKLRIVAKNSGVISGLTVKVGENVKMGTTIATVANTKKMQVDLPFTQAQIGSIAVGDVARITSSQHMSSVDGTVTHKAAVSYAGSDGSKLYDVTIIFDNPGAFYEGLDVGGSVGSLVSPGYGTIENSSSGTISAEVDGTVSKVYRANGDYVEKGALIATLTSDTISNKIEDSSLSYRNAGISMQQSQEELDDYSITSPISGTVITKNSKAGDTIDKTNSSTVMMVVADISKLKFDLEIDELDVSKVAVGQTVDVTCDALPDEEYQGIITKVSVEGTASNGVTTYTAEVEIDNPGNLRPSMNIDATVIVQSASDVLRVPTEDLKTVKNKNYLFVKDENAERKNDSGEKKKNEKPGKTDGMTPTNGENAPDSAAKDGMPQAPDGYKAVEVEIGISGDDYTEIIRGVNEGDLIYRQTVESSGNNNMMMMGGHGGMGGAPSGGMGGGPSGGGPR